MPDSTDPNPTIQTGGGAHAGGGAHVSGGGFQAGSDINLGAKTVMGDEVGVKIVHQYGDRSPLPPFTPAPLPPLAPDGRPPLPDPVPLPPGSRLDYDRNPFFTGRENEMRALAQALLYGPPGRPAVIATGIGGIGKTQLAVEFAYRYGRYFHGVHWVSMADPAAVGTEIAQCGALMGLRPDFDSLPLEAQTRLTLAAWGEPAARLIIFDNCEEPGLLAQWRPGSGGARILATTRRGHWPRIAGVAQLPVGALPREQAVALLAKYVTGRATPPATRHPLPTTLSEIAAELGDLPLALHLAGSYLESYAGDPAGTPAALLAQLRDPVLGLQAAALIGRGAADSPTAHELHVANTFLLSWQRLATVTADGGAMAAALLALSLIHI